MFVDNAAKALELARARADLQHKLRELNENESYFTLEFFGYGYNPDAKTDPRRRSSIKTKLFDLGVANSRDTSLSVKLQDEPNSPMAIALKAFIQSALQEQLDVVETELRQLGVTLEG